MAKYTEPSSKIELNLLIPLLCVAAELFVLSGSLGLVADPSLPRLFNTAASYAVISTVVTSLTVASALWNVGRKNNGRFNKLGGVGLTIGAGLLGSAVYQGYLKAIGDTTAYAVIGAGSLATGFLPGLTFALSLAGITYGMYGLVSELGKEREHKKLKELIAS
jgi:hypothetical protein